MGALWRRWATSKGFGLICLMLLSTAQSANVASMAFLAAPPKDVATTTKEVFNAVMDVTSLNMPMTTTKLQRIWHVTTNLAEGPKYVTGAAYALARTAWNSLKEPKFNQTVLHPSNWMWLQPTRSRYPPEVWRPQRFTAELIKKHDVKPFWTERTLTDKQEVHGDVTPVSLWSFLFGLKSTDGSDGTWTPRMTAAEFTSIALFVMPIAAVGMARRGFGDTGDNLGTTSDPPTWAPAGNVSFRRWTQNLAVWLNLTSTRMAPPQQAAAIQLALRGAAHELALTIPAAAIQSGAMVNGTPTDPVTYLIFQLANRFEAMEDERTMEHANVLLDFRRQHGERFDATILRFDMARTEAASVGGISNFYTLTTILLRVLAPSAPQLVHLLQPLGGRMPQTQDQYDTFIQQARQMYHILEHNPMNIMRGFQGHGHHRQWLVDGIQQPPDPSTQPMWNMSGTDNTQGAQSWDGTTWNPGDNNAGHTPDGQWSYSAVPQSASPDNSVFGGGGQWVPPTQPVQHSGDNSNVFYGAENQDMSSDNGTDTDTSSDCGDDNDDFDDIDGWQDMDEVDRGENLFLKYARAKRRFRRHFRKPTRKVRRFWRRRHQGKGKGKGKRQRFTGKGIFLAVNQMDDNAYEAVFFQRGRKGKGKSKGRRSTGKGRGRRLNPLDKEGKRTKCDNCGSEEHFRAHCPQGKGKGNGGGGKGRGNHQPQSIQYIENESQLTQDTTGNTWFIDTRPTFVREVPNMQDTDARDLMTDTIWIRDRDLGPDIDYDSSDSEEDPRGIWNDRDEMTRHLANLHNICPDYDPEDFPYTLDQFFELPTRERYEFTTAHLILMEHLRNPTSILPFNDFYRNPSREWEETLIAGLSPDALERIIRRGRTQLENATRIITQARTDMWLQRMLSEGPGHISVDPSPAGTPDVLMPELYEDNGVTNEGSSGQDSDQTEEVLSSPPSTEDYDAGDEFALPLAMMDMISDFAGDLPHFSVDLSNEESRRPSVEMYYIGEDPDPVVVHPDTDMHPDEHGGCWMINSVQSDDAGQQNDKKFSPCLDSQILNLHIKKVGSKKDYFDEFGQRDDIRMIARDAYGNAPPGPHKMTPGGRIPDHGRQEESELTLNLKEKGAEASKPVYINTFQKRGTGDRMKESSDPGPRRTKFRKVCRGPHVQAGISNLMDVHTAGGFHVGDRLEQQNVPFEGYKPTDFTLTNLDRIIRRINRFNAPKGIQVKTDWQKEFSNGFRPQNPIAAPPDYHIMHENGHWYKPEKLREWYKIHVAGDITEPILDALCDLAHLRGVSTCKTLRWNNEARRHCSYSEFILTHGWEQGDYLWIQAALEHAYYFSDEFHSLNNINHTDVPEDDPEYQIHMGPSVDEGDFQLARDFLMRCYLNCDINDACDSPFDGIGRHEINSVAEALHFRRTQSEQGQPTREVLIPAMFAWPEHTYHGAGTPSYEAHPADGVQYGTRWGSQRPVCRGRATDRPTWCPGEDDKMEGKEFLYTLNYVKPMPRPWREGYHQGRREAAPYSERQEYFRPVCSLPANVAEDRGDVTSQHDLVERLSEEYELKARGHQYGIDRHHSLVEERKRYEADIRSGKPRIGFKDGWGYGANLMSSPPGHYPIPTDKTTRLQVSTPAPAEHMMRHMDRTKYRFKETEKDPWKPASDCQESAVFQGRSTASAEQLLKRVRNDAGMRWITYDMTYPQRQYELDWINEQSPLQETSISTHA